MVWRRYAREDRGSDIGGRSELSGAVAKGVASGSGGGVEVSRNIAYNT